MNLTARGGVTPSGVLRAYESYGRPMWSPRAVGRYILAGAGAGGAGVPMVVMNSLLRQLGVELRAARRRSGLALREVAARSASSFKASSVGGYERGERSISVDRLCTLARAYGVRPDRLLSRALTRVDAERSQPIVVDLGASASGSGEDGQLIKLARDVAAMRGVEATDRLILRSSDLELLANLADDA